MPNNVDNCSDEAASTVEADMDNFSDEDDGYGRMTNELGEVTFPHRPVGAKLLIGVKDRPGYYSNVFPYLSYAWNKFCIFSSATRMLGRSSK